MQTNYINKQSIISLALITFITSNVLQAEQQISYYQPRQASYPQPQQSSSTAWSITKGIVKGGWNIFKIYIGVKTLHLCYNYSQYCNASSTASAQVHNLVADFNTLYENTLFYTIVPGLFITADGFRELYKLLFKRNEQEATPTTDAFQTPAN